MSTTTLAALKATYYHPSNKLTLPAWLGRTTRVKDTLDDGFGKLDVDYLTFDAPGDAQVSNVFWASPGPSSLSLIAKEQIVSKLYQWSDVWDLDVRVQCTDKSVEDPLNWEMIKRFCDCWPDQLRADTETSINAGDGETVLNVPVTSVCRPVIIKPVTPVLESLDQAAVNQAPTISAIHNNTTNDYIINPDDNNNTIEATDIDALEHVVVMSKSGGLSYSHDGGLYYSSYTIAGGVVTAVRMGDYSTVLASVVVGGNYHLYLSTDGGKTYSQLVTAAKLLASVVKIDWDGYGNFYLLDTAGTVYRYNKLLGLQILGDTGLSVPTDLLWSDGILYASGFTTVPVIMASEDGEVWTTVYIGQGGSSAFFDVNPTFKLASNGSGVIYAALHSVVDQSADGYTFESHAIGLGNALSVTYGNGIYVSLPFDSDDVAISTDGINWVIYPNALPSSARWNDIVYAAGLFVAVGAHSILPQAVCATSPDGINWTNHAVPGFPLYGLIYAGGQFVAVGLANCLTSPDGLVWTSQVIPANAYSDIAWMGGTYVASGGLGYVATSPDGVNWAPSDTGSGVTLFAVAASGSEFVVVGDSNTCLTSPDGNIWTPQTIPVGIILRLVWNGDVFCGLSYNGSLAFTSPDGVNWTTYTIPTSDWSALTTNGLRIVGISATGFMSVIGLESPVMGLFRTHMLRSVNWGATGTWQLEYYEEKLLSADEVIFVPSDMACAHVNHAKAVGYEYQLGVVDPEHGYDAPVFVQYKSLTLE